MGQRVIEREIHIDAGPEVVYEVISTPKHLREWWPDDTDLEAVAGATGVVKFGDTKVEPVTVVEADPPRRFCFRWGYGDGAVATSDNSLLVTFDLVPSGAGTLLRFSETGYEAVANSDEVYRDHLTGWDYFLPRLAPYVDRLVSTP
ncbi:SRPBCC domain-containing protein [Kribbella sp. NPDC023972]|uniref:SRPBCC domain-containing protein n=1 Tax=Kribbella sp. NPDC023972 TaxID=3154795 RepID=UPI0033C730E0